ncbi:DUF4815 domain-containing protein [Chelatococcus sp. XZ-Ab1]|uniref:DUF4815 domain-containing protein n=1 Tax=Chelatococcus sp. XZ-Ab1 TaxID=3034027 RepID=UPI0023E47400|nr:DUF4815 domain-containing protein [Chelatococcus sp. XZ-Ab1]
MSHEHPSGVPGAYDRSADHPDWARVVMREDRIAQAAEINEIQSLGERRVRRIGNLIAKDGDRQEGADIIVDTEAGTVSLTAGRIYVAGDVRPVEAAVLTDVPMTGEVRVGVRLIGTVVTEDDEPSLVGLHPGTEGEGEPGAARVAEHLVWALADDEQPGEFISVYVLRDGTVIDQMPPPALTGVIQQIARYDYDALGHYIVDGCEVTPLGRIGTDQVYSIAAGTANISGFKRIRETALRYAVPEDPDLEPIAAEPHTFTGPTGGSSIVAVSRPPIAAVTSAIVVKRVTETLVRGPVAGGTDPLQFPAVVEIESVVQGGTTFASSTYALAGDGVSWAPGGAEPAPGSSYQVTYLYNVAVVPDNVTDREVTVSGGVQGRPVLVSYTSKVPRIDLICMDVMGRAAYVRGISARNGGLPPIAPTSLLKLAEVHHNWFGAPTVINNGTRNYTFDQQRRLFGRLIDVLETFDRSEAERDILAREPVAKRGIFTDAFVDDFYRDQGAVQTAAINRGVLQLAIDNVLMQRAGSAIETLPWAEEVIVSQPLRTSSMKINPYMNFTAMPAALVLEPAADFWTEVQTQWTSPVTREFTAAPDTPPGSTTINEVVEIQRTQAEFLRQIPIQATIEGFSPNENLSKLTFDGVDVKPPGTQTTGPDGRLIVSFQIPANMPAGRRMVRAEGAAGGFAQAIFVGEGTVDINTMRRVTLVARAAPDPVQITNITVVNQITNVVIRQPEAQQQQGADQSSGEGGSSDPLAQPFTLPEPRHIAGINFRFTAIGNRANGVRVQLSTVLNGYPTNEVLAEAFVNMQTVEVGELVEARFRTPVFLPADRQFCFVVLTADADHAVAIARLGDVDPLTQQRVSSHPYTVAPLFSSVNRLAWTAHQDTAMHFELVAAKFTATSRTIDLWTGEFQQISDVLVRGTVDIPSDAARFRYELVSGSTVIALAPGQGVAFSEFVTGEVTLRAVLTGTAKVAPILYPGTTLVGGRIRPSGTYITRAFDMGNAVRVAALFAARLPAGSAVAVHVDGTDNNWQPLSAAGAGVLGGGWTEPRYERTNFTAQQGRIRITLTGSPGARPSIARLRAYSV